MFYSLFPDEIFPEGNGLLARVGQITYYLEMSSTDVSNLERLNVNNTPDPQLQIFTLIETTDTEINLIGFSSKERKELYQGLKAVKGIGSKSALIIMDAGQVIDILRAVSAGDYEFLSGVPGVGEKRLKFIFSTLEKRYKKTLPNKLPVKVSSWVEARDSLMLEGASFDQAEKRLYEITKNAPEEITAEALYLQAKS